MEKRVDLLIIGSGPFGLAMGAYAQHLEIDYAIVGKPMEFWKAHMPKGMYLRSATVPNLDPMNRHTIEAFLETQGLTHADVEQPSLRFYLNYAQWFQEQKRLEALPVFICRLCHVDDDEDRFQATLDDGRIIRAKYVVIAVGFKPFKHLPPELVERPLGHFSHTCDRVNFQGTGRQTVSDHRWTTERLRMGCLAP
jgi:thioredoxin reductase